MATADPLEQSQQAARITFISIIRSTSPKASAAPPVTAPVATMPLMRQAAPLTMGWCLDCHRDPAPNLRPAAEVFDPDWQCAAPTRRGAAQILAHQNIDNSTSHRLLGLPPMNEHLHLDQEQDVQPPGDVDRRAALKLFVSGAALALASCGRPDEKIVPYVDIPRARDARASRCASPPRCRLPAMAAASS